MRKLSFLALSLVFLLSGCGAPNFQKQNEVVQTNQQSTGKAIIPKYKVPGGYYQTILPFETGTTRGMVVNNLNTRYDINEFETGLMRVAMKSFSPEQYYFREGQEIPQATVQSWLNRKTNKNPEGLNPPDPKGDGSTPMYVSEILEHDYMVKGNNNTIKLGGVVIGIALNSTYYYQKPQYGPTYDVPLSDQVITTQGEQIAAEILTRLRNMKGLQNIPITIALFKEQSESSLIPGNFFAYTNADNGSSSISGWTSINEKYYLFPSTGAQTDHPADLTQFTNFEQSVQQYFPNYTGVIGTAFYVNNQLQDLRISIPIQFYGETEAIGFTQYVTGLVIQNFPKNISVSVYVSSVDGPEALIDRQANQDQPYVYMY